MDWDTYYEKFYDWAASTQIRHISSLTSFGPSAEIAEVAQECLDEKAASRLIKKALAAGVSFTPEEICELSDCCNTSVMNELLKSAQGPFTQEQLEELWGTVDEEVLTLVAKRNHVALFEDEEEDMEDEAFPDMPEAPAFTPGFFSLLGQALGVTRILGHQNQPHPGHCTGDCAHCPPHYGYRYGRWYYGHHHTHGCEFGGNSGSGGQ